MKKIILILVLIGFSASLAGQNLIIDSDLTADSTNLTFEKRDKVRKEYSSFDNKKTDSLQISFGTVGVTVLSIKIDFSKEAVKPVLVLWSDAPDFNGSHTLEVPLIKYDLTLNKTDFQMGDIAMGYIVAKSDTISDLIGDYTVSVSGNFRHIVGKTMIKRNAESNYYIKD